MNLLILVVDDEIDVEMLFRQQFRRDLRAGRFVMEFVQSAPAALQRISDETEASLILILSDINMPGMTGLELLPKAKAVRPDVPIIIITAYGSVRRAMEATKDAGAFYVLEKPFDPEEVLGLVKNALDHRKLVAENTDLRRRLGEQTADSEILFAAPSMQRVMETVAAVADADANVLLVGESGTGKELIANALHERSRRQTSIPSIPGRFRSNTTRSGLDASASTRASSPSTAVTTSYPRAVRARRTARRICCSSSTTRIRLTARHVTAGMETANVAPPPGVSSIQISPPIAATNPLAIARPRPDPRRGLRWSRS